MKKIIILIVALFSFISAYSQMPVDCESDPCYQTQSWSGTLLSPQYPLGPMPACSGCWVQILYKTRNNSTNPGCLSLPPIEYQLIGVVVSGTCFYPPCGYYTFSDLKKAYQDGMAQFLNTLGYSPVHPNDCGPVLKGFSIISCFREDTDIDGNIFLRACYNFTCCKQELQLCKVGGNIEVHSTKTTSVGDCANDPNYPDDCMTVCNWIDDAILPKEALLDTRKPTESPLKIIPNPQIGEVLNFSFASDSKISDLYLIDPQGKIIRINKDAFLGEFTFKTQGLSSGNYVLVLKTESNETYYENFIINK